jgi:hypothetical protein
MPLARLSGRDQSLYHKQGRSFGEIILALTIGAAHT